MHSLGTRGVRLEIDNVNKVFGEAFEALRPTTIDIQPGEFVSVVGPSGCGKSTLMLMVAGLMKATNGVVRVGGKVLSGPMTDVGIVFQDHLLLDFRTAVDNVLLQGVIRKLPMAPVRERTRRIVRTSWPDGCGRPVPASTLRRNASARVPCARAGAPSVRSLDG